MKVVVDMNLSVMWPEFLRERGIDCRHWSAIGDADAPDTQIMEHAQSEDAVILTADLDFALLHAIRGSHKPSVIQLRGADKLPAALGHAVARSLSVARGELEQGAVVTITAKKVRVTKLPLGNLDSF